MATLASHVLAQVSAHEKRKHAEVAQLQSHLQEDHLMHGLLMQQQERKMQQLLDYSTGATVTHAQLQQRKHAPPLAQPQPQPLPLSQLQPTVMPLQPSAPAPLIAAATPVASATPVAVAAAAAAAMPSAAWPAAASGSAGFDVRDWLSLQNAPPPAIVPQASLRSSPPPIFVGQSPHRLPVGYAPAIPSYGPRAPFPQQPQSMQPLSMHSYLPPSSSAAPSYPNYAATAMMSPEVALAASPSSAAARDSRSIHVQRLAEVEAALNAMTELEQR